MGLDKSPLAYATIKKWAVLFKAGRESIKDDHGPGRPSTAVYEFKVAFVEPMVVEDRLISVLCCSTPELVCGVRRNHPS